MQIFSLNKVISLSTNARQAARVYKMAENEVTDDAAVHVSNISIVEIAA